MKRIVKHIQMIWWWILGGMSLKMGEPFVNRCRKIRDKYPTPTKIPMHDLDWWTMQMAWFFANSLKLCNDRIDKVIKELEAM